MFCSLCVSHRAFLCPAALHVQWLPGAKLFFLRNLLFDVDIKSTNPKEFKVFLCIREGVFFGSGQAKEIPLQLSSLPFISRFAQFDEWDNQCEKWEAKSQKPDTQHSGALCPFRSLNSKVLSPVLASCHTYFNYLTGLQRQEREWVSNRRHFSSSPEGYEGCCKRLRVIFGSMSWGKATLRLWSHFSGTSNERF